MPYRVEVSTQANRDLDRIYRYIRAATSDKAADWFNGLHVALRSLAEMPLRHPATHENPLLRHLLYGSKPHIYRAIYFVNEERGTVTILAIRHGARRAFKPKDIKLPNT